MSRATETSASGQTMRVRRAGGDVERVGDAGRNAGYFAQDGDRLLFADYVEGGSVIAIDASGENESASMVTVAAQRASPLFVALDGSSAFFSDDSGARIMRADVDDPGAVNVAFAAPNNGINWLTRDEEFLYWVGGAGDEGAIQRIPLLPIGDAPPQLEVLAPATVSAATLLVTNDAFFVSDDFGRLLRIDRSDGTEEIYGERMYRAAHDATHVYWSDPGDFDGTGSIRARPLNGGDEEILADGLALPYTVAVDACAVYWVDLNDLTIRSAAK